MEQCPRLLTTTRERGAQQLGPLPKEQSSEQGSNRGGAFWACPHCWKRASKRLGTKRLGPDKGWVRPTLGTRCSLIIKRAHRHTLLSASRPTVSALPYGDFPSTAPTPSPTAGPQGTLHHRVLNKKRPTDPFAQAKVHKAWLAARSPSKAREKGE